MGFVIVMEYAYLSRERMNELRLEGDTAVFGLHLRKKLDLRARVNKITHTFEIGSALFRFTQLI